MYQGRHKHSPRAARRRFKLKFLSPASLAEELDVSEHTLANWLIREPGRLTTVTVRHGETEREQTENGNSASKASPRMGRAGRFE
jgi:hypothetical protein